VDGCAKKWEQSVELNGMISGRAQEDSQKWLSHLQGSLCSLGGAFEAQDKLKPGLYNAIETALRLAYCVVPHMVGDLPVAVGLLY
jgi:hypothetical protein